MLKKKMRDKILFLLGGYDLEMVEIKKILEENGVDFKDKHLSWGAKLSEYEEYLDFDGKIYGIELVEDIEPPTNYIAIDHHNKRYKQKSSLEQVAEILDLKLTRWQQLVAANDRGYIPEMRRLCATDDEIKKIRREDRLAQGITENEEKIAELEIENIKEIDGVYLLKTTLKHFSPLVDRTDKRPLIIYNEHTLSVFADNIEELIKSFKDEIDKHLCYYGGNPLGYFGFSEEYFKKESINETVNRILEIMKKRVKKLYSYHTFMFPFIFDGKPKVSDEWIYKKFKIESQKDYNEYVYFYKHVQDALFNKKDEANEYISKYYEYIDQEGTFTIECKKGIYELEIDGISLRIFNTNVAIISFNLINRKYKNSEDILAINDFGRRIYPQFLGENFTCETKNSFLANSITIHQPKLNKTIKEDFSKFDKKENLNVNMNLLPSYIDHYLKKSFKSYRHIIDDRMFVISLYLSEDMSNRLKSVEEDKYTYENDEFWYKYIFIDSESKTCQSRYMTKKLILESTYDRWVDWGTLFGISRYSFVAVSSGRFGKNVLLTYMQTMYFQIFTLLLAYRASIIYFSDEIQNTSEKDDTKIAECTEKHYKKYLNFLNRLYFKEVTAQDQGIELYDKALKIMKIEQHLADLDNEINELHSYVEMIEEKKESRSINNLTKLGTIFLPASLIASIFGMNIYPLNNDNVFDWIIFIIVTIIVTWRLSYLHKLETLEYLIGKKEKNE